MWHVRFDGSSEIMSVRALDEEKAAERAVQRWDERHVEFSDETRVYVRFVPDSAKDAPGPWERFEVTGRMNPEYRAKRV
jgi:hypothetical protein